MPVIKRYPNRKLYDTESKKYITLDGIADLIRQGSEVQVVDHTTDEDLTAVTLTQIIFEQEKKRGGFLPKSVLTGLVRSGGDTVNSLRRSLISPLGLLRHVDEEIERRLQDLVSRGELAREEANRLRDKLLSRGTAVSDMVPGKDALEAILGKTGIPSQEDVRKLHDQIEELTAKVEQLSHSQES
ncbi:MAG: polyhydroxyalkanoate synthesis regulator DNA-binding domain-containing protein [Anaerolineae bacterium]